MSDTTQNIRVVLGPVARSLIPDGADNRQDALDAAITDLMQSGADHHDSAWSDTGSTLSPSSDGPSLHQAIVLMQDDVQRMGRALVEMKEIALAEMRMTRLLVGTLVDQSNEEHHALLRFAGEMIQKMYENSELLTKEDLQELERKEELFQRLNRIEMDRAAEPRKDHDKDEEIVR